jgi:ribosomal-protein-alanine N-acetyltransferase
MTTRLRLKTSRLLLEPFTPEFIEALDADRDRAEAMLDAEIPAGWPDDDLAHLISIYGPWAAQDQSRVGYGPWIVIADRVVIGSAGFQGTPKHDGAIELGFGIHGDHRNRGYATEAARALVTWGLTQPPVRRVVARCEPGNAASIRVLAKIGMVRAGEADGSLLWEMPDAG